MHLHFGRTRSLQIALAVLTIFGALLLTVACGDDEGGAASETSAIEGIYILDKAGLHGLDDSMNKDKTIPANARTIYQQLQTVTLLVDWPNDDLQKKADALAKTFADAAAALDGDAPDITKAGAAAAAAHDGEHDFSHEVWEYLYDKAGVKVAAEADHD